MIYTPMTKKAMQLAYGAHHGQLDKSGLPYIHHVLHVAEQMKDEHTTIAALLHDTVEDTSVTLEQLSQEGFPSDVIDTIRNLTYDKSIPYLDYIRELRSNPSAVAVKLADLEHNSDVSRLEFVTEADLQRKEKYEQAKAILRITEVVAALIWDGDKFMICQRPAHKARGLLWEFVGGKTEPGESSAQALIRECQEELAVTVDVRDVFMNVMHYYPDLTVNLILFNASIAEGVPQKLEHNDIRWITPSEIDDYAFCPADEEILAEIKRRQMIASAI